MTIFFYWLNIFYKYNEKELSFWWKSESKNRFYSFIKKIFMNLEKILKEINIDLEKIKNSRPLSKIELQELRKSLWVMFVQNSNAIEWNTYTLWETKLLLEDWITVWWKTLKEQNEVLNHRELLSILYNFLEKSGLSISSFSTILATPAALEESFKTISDEIASQRTVRKSSCNWAGNSTFCPSFSKVNIW